MDYATLVEFFGLLILAVITNQLFLGTLVIFFSILSESVQTLSWFCDSSIFELNPSFFLSVKFFIVLPFCHLISFSVSVFRLWLLAASAIKAFGRVLILILFIVEIKKTTLKRVLKLP